MTDWQAEGLHKWVLVARAHARLRPSAPLSLAGLSTAQRKQAIATALDPYTNNNKVTITDYAGQQISHKLTYFCSKLLIDIGHAAHVCWIPETLANPIEVWDRVDKPTDPAPKRHYFSAYSNPAGTIVYYVAVAVAANGLFVTAFQKDSGAGIDGKRNGAPIYRCY